MRHSAAETLETTRLVEDSAWSVPAALRELGIPRCMVSGWSARPGARPRSAGHRRGVEPAGHAAETFVHDLALFPGHALLPSQGRTCSPCLRNQT